MDDVTFGRNGRKAGKGWQHSATAMNDVAIPVWSLMSMNACFVVCNVLLSVAAFDIFYCLQLYLLHIGFQHVSLECFSSYQLGVWLV